ncbi:hypothetical protein SCHPADRAFT_248814 [Schizopora paradoxa]|uniref:Uncharacterized protein n=1 Tax=Schizopora paradoxa TaxID=27342 RepID=A0A0H2S1U5_9AGAM|nr:hypothetical protein SCHPADRAFT_248814 [Schizopora paradoxa]
MVAESAAQVFHGRQQGHISCLPVEVLTDAFTYLLPKSLVIDDAIGAHALKPDCCLHRRRKHDDIINISHVCRPWRSICLAAPSLWNLLWITDEDHFTPRTEEFIRRSANMPLEVAVRDELRRNWRLFPYQQDVNPFKGPLIHPLLKFFNLVPCALQRLKTLRICSGFSTSQDFTSCFDKPAPLLESFALYFDHMGTDGVESTSHILPSPLFSDSTPSLRQLSIHHAEVPWTSNIFKNLTLLCIWRDEEHEADHVEVNLLLQIMRNCPEIVSLEIGFAGPTLLADDSTHPSSLTSKVPALSLKNIKLYGMAELEPVLVFLSRLQTSRLQSLIVGHLGLFLLNIDDFVPQTVTFDPRSNLCNCLWIDVDPNCEWVIAEQFMLDGLESKMTLDPKYFSLRWLQKTKSSFKRHISCLNDDNGVHHYEVDPNDYRILSLTFLQRMCPSSETIRAITIRGSDSALDELAFEGIFGYFSNLYCIEVRHNMDLVEAGSFMEYLATQAEVTEECFSADMIALQSVHMLIFENVEFKPGNFDFLCCFLRHRKRREAPIQYI